jgi:hypothetical protein
MSDSNSDAVPIDAVCMNLSSTPRDGVDKVIGW